MLEIAYHYLRLSKSWREREDWRQLAEERGWRGGTGGGRPRGLAVPEAEWPQTDLRRDMPRGVLAIADLLKVLLKMKCEEADVAQRLVASSEEWNLSPHSARRRTSRRCMAGAVGCWRRCPTHSRR